MANMMPRRLPGGKWFYPDIEEAMKAAGMYTIEHYFLKRQARIVNYITNRPIWAHCMAATRKHGSSSQRRLWWGNPGRSMTQDSEDDGYL
jgi:hypothetical protein